MPVSEKSRAKLSAVSTATLTTVLFKRGFRNTFIQGIHRLNPGGAAMVGPAYTMRYIPAREDLDHLGVFEGRSHPQRKGVEECPAGHVFVIDSRRNPAAASAGGILVTRLWKRGAAGIVTDGGFRDSPQIARLPFPAYHAAPAAPTNLIKHHAVDLDVPIACGEVPVYPGDIIVGDDEGQIALKKLQLHLTRMPRTLPAAQVTQINDRLRAMGDLMTNAPIPKGPMPKGARMPKGGRPR